MKKLKFVALSGTTGVTENMYVYEYGNDLIVVDCGVGFPDSDMHGVDLVLPDFSYLKQNKEKIRGLVITHGHEDHIGAISYFLKEINTTIHATRLTGGFIEDKLIDHNIKNYKINIFDSEKDTIHLGAFRISPFRISHSIPDAAGLCIETPVGKVFHVPDYKFDWTPVDGKPFDIARASNLAQGGVLLLASDSLGSNHPGYTKSEKEIESRIEKIVEKSKGQVYFTTISSNISRMQQAMNVAKKLNRKVALVGRSIVSKAEIAKNLGYLHYDRSLIISPRKARRMRPDKVMFVISGTYGQSGSALYKAILGEHDFLKVTASDTVIFSSDPAPPGSKESVDFLVDKLIEMNADVHYYDMQEDLHVSGHGSQQDIKMLFSIVKPKFFSPIGGTIRHNRGYRKIAVSMGANENQVLELSPGDIVEFDQNSAKKRKSFPVRQVLVDGLGVGDVGNVVLRDRQVLAQDGVAIVVLQINLLDKKLIHVPEIISRGFVFEKEEKDFLIKSAEKLKDYLDKKSVNNLYIIKKLTEDYLSNHFFRTTGRRPMILPVIVEI